VNGYPVWLCPFGHMVDARRAAHEPFARFGFTFSYCDECGKKVEVSSHNHKEVCDARTHAEGRGADSAKAG
jgi:hypothetical protein